MALPPPPYPSASGLLTNKTVVVTAAAGTGIGYATAKRCIEEGATVLISDIHERRLGEAATRIGDETGTAPLTAVCNVTDEAQVQGLVTTAIEQLGHIDVWMNNAGLGGNAAVVDMTDEQWNVVLDVTLTGTFRCSGRCCHTCTSGAKAPSSTTPRFSVGEPRNFKNTMPPPRPE